MIGVGFYEYTDEYTKKDIFYYWGRRYRAVAPPGAIRNFWKRYSPPSTPVASSGVGTGMDIGSTWMNDSQQVRRYIANGYDGTHKAVWCNWYFGTGV